MIGNKPATYRSPLCVYCNAATTDQSIVVGGYAVVVCDDCDLRNIFSDAYKEEYGVRPKHFVPARAKRAFLRSLSQEAQS